MTNKTTLLGVIEQHIKGQGCDGLYNADGDCACLLGHLAPCEQINLTECTPGVRKDHPEDCSCCDDGCVWQSGWAVHAKGAFK